MRIREKYSALLQKNRYPGKEDKAAALVGVNPYFYREYDEAVRSYPLPKAMAVISLLCRYDSLGKGGGGAVTTEPGELLVELTAAYSTHKIPAISRTESH